jgi:DNA-binding transcriptional MerR regulator
MAKSRDAFRTISEVSDVLDTPAHVLRFWESKFSQIKPVKRAGGRRYYRPDDVSLLAGIQHLLHDDGMTIKGAQKLLREKGVKHVVAIGEGLDGVEPSDEPITTTASNATVQAVSDIMQEQDATQTDMFEAPIASEPVSEPTLAPRLQIISAKPVPDTAPETKAMTPDSTSSNVTPETAETDVPPPSNPISALSPFAKPKQDIPPNPTPRTDITARCLAAIVTADRDRVRANAAAITPLLNRLSALRDEMRHPW